MSKTVTIDNKDVELTEHNTHWGGQHWTEWFYVNNRYKKVALKTEGTTHMVFDVFSLGHFKEYNRVIWEGKITDRALMESPDWLRVKQPTNTNENE